MRGEPAAVLAYRLDDRLLVQYLVAEDVFFQHPAIRAAIADHHLLRAADGDRTVVAWPDSTTGTVLVGNIPPESLRPSGARRVRADPSPAPRFAMSCPTAFRRDRGGTGNPAGRRFRAAPATPATPAATASPDSLSPDSLAARLARAEAAIAALRQQMATESQTTVHTRSRLQLDLTGMIITNGFYTSGRANSIDVPLVALAPSDASESNAFGATVRQTRLGGVVTVSQVLGGSFIGDLDIDFFGGVSNGPGDRRLFPEPRLRTTTATLRWARTDLMVGSDVPLVTRLTPISVAAIGIPEFSGIGQSLELAAADPSDAACRDDGAGAHDAALVRAGLRHGAVRRRAVPR